MGTLLSDNLIRQNELVDDLRIENARLREVLKALIKAFYQDAIGSEWINVHLDGASGPVTPALAPALTVVCVCAARAALEGDGNE